MTCSSPFWLHLGGATRGICVLLDEADAHLVVGRRWHPVKMRGAVTHYASDRNGVRMHRVVLEAPKGMVVDHIDGNVWDNRRHNLRIATTTQNRQNIHHSERQKRGEHKGVAPRWKRFAGQIAKDGKKYHLGTFATSEEAARAYDAKARELFGEFAALNFPDES